MDSPLVQRVLRDLVRRSSRHAPLNATSACRNCLAQQRRFKSSSSKPAAPAAPAAPAPAKAVDKKKLIWEVNWQPRNKLFIADKNEEFSRYPLVTADQLRTWKTRPKRVKMLTRDFIEDSLYNPNYGYFSKQVVIFRPGEPFDFPSIRDEPEFHRILANRYLDFEDKLDEQKQNDARQLWHTPTELFSPYYGEALARFMVANYKLTQFPYHDLIIYELGAGNGTLMLNILDYIERMFPEVYERTKFRIIEITPALAALQTAGAMSSRHADRVEVINKSILGWDTYVPEPCFVLAQEVFDNLAHDAVRYDLETEQPLQGMVLIDNEGDFYEFYTPDLDPLASRFLKVRDAAVTTSYKSPLKTSKLIRKAREILPFSGNLSDPEYLPTRLLELFGVLSEYFPQHRLLSSDFHKLPDATRGFNAPVVQTRYQRQTIAVTTPLVQQGFFDVLFPTDFQVMQQIYQAMTGKLTRVFTQREFLERWADTEATTVKSGENPLLSWYQNASVLVTE